MMFINLPKGIEAVTGAINNLDAGTFGSTLRQKEITMPLTDLIIFTVALHNNCAIWSRDKQFQIIREATGSDLEIYDPAGK